MKDSAFLSNTQTTSDYLNIKKLHDPNQLTFYIESKIATAFCCISQHLYSFSKAEVTKHFVPSSKYGNDIPQSR